MRLNGEAKMLNASAFLPMGARHHVAGVFDGSHMRVYVDGVLDGSLNTTDAPGLGTSLLRIGRAAHAANSPRLYSISSIGGSHRETRNVLQDFAGGLQR